MHIPCIMITHVQPIRHRLTLTLLWGVCNGSSCRQPAGASGWYHQDLHAVCARPR